MNNLTRKMKIATKKTLSMGLFMGAALVVMMMVTAAGGGFPVKTNPFIDNLKTKLKAYEQHLPEDRIYVQFDKPLYTPGDDVWFAAYLRDGKTLKASTKSEILYVDLINPKGRVQESIKLITKDGFVAGDFALGQEVLGGMYKVKAYTKWQENQKEGFAFEKEFQVQKVVLPNLKMKLDFDRKAFGPGDEVVASLDLQSNDNKPLANYAFDGAVNLDGESFTKVKGSTDAMGKAKVKFRLPAELETNDGLLNVLISYNGLTESISRSVPIVLNKIDLQFFPEGGDLVAGQSSKVAFKAINEFGKPADIEGVVEDQNGATIANFQSFHMGMGAFTFNPEKGQTFKARITKPEGIKESYELPEALPRGFVLNVPKVDEKEMSVVIRSTESEAVSLVAQVRGEVYWSSEVTVLPGKTELSIPLAQFPMGVCQLTLFDGKGIERCERLAFVNRDRQLNVDISTNKEKYLPREKVKMTVRVTDDRGMPMPAMLSLAVTNDQMLSFADDKSGTILSQLLLEHDLKQKVEEPRFYFDEKEANSLAALDHLMLTSGWRRFVWEAVLEDQLPALANQGEIATISGVVLDAYTRKPIPRASVLAPNSKRTAITDENGKFSFRQFDISQDNQLTISGANFSPSNIFLGNTYAGEKQGYLYGANTYTWNATAAGNANVKMAAPAGGMRNKGIADNKKDLVARPEVAPMRAMKQNDMPIANGERVQVLQVEDKEMAWEAEPMIEEIAFDDDGIEPQRKLEDPKPQGGPDMNALGLMDGFAADSMIAGKIFDGRFAQIQQQEQKNLENQQRGPRFHRARQFPTPVYAGPDYVAPDHRSDFRQTVFWKPDLKVDRTGKAVVEFYNSDEISSFRAIAEGISVDGQVGRGELLFFTQLPFSMQARVPVEVATGDNMVVPVVLKNNTEENLSGSLHVMPPSGLEALSTTGSMVSIPAGAAQTLYLAYKVKHQPGEEVFNIAFAGAGHTDAFEQKLKIVAQGFPVALSFSGRELDTQHKFKIAKTVPGSISASFTAFPNVVSDLVKGIESILREPYGCFEQTSTSSYPNAMVMSYMQEQDQVDPAIMKRAADLLDKGYKRLVTFETKEKGYEWFGSSPGHEALTAYGLMQFSDYGKVMEGVDQDMVKRTADWLMSRRDGQGGFQRSGKAIDQFGYADQDVTNAYIVYALSEAGRKDIMAEAESALKVALKDKDAYQLALVTNAMYNLGKADKGREALTALLALQKNDGSFTGTKGSITRSGGVSLTVETTSLAALAMMKSGKPDNKSLENAVSSIVKARSGAGGFGSTQGTILGLKAMVEYTKFNKRIDEAGVVEIYVDGKKVAEQAYAAGQREAVEIKGLEAFIGEGNHSLDVKFKGVKQALPYSIAVDYNTTLPNSNKECVVGLETKLSGTKAKMGETLRLNAKLNNRTQEGQPMTMAIIGLPAGLSAQPWQLKELQEKKIVDFYEIIGNNVVCYYRQMAPGQVREINLDLKAEVPGEYTAPASCAYLYYTAEFRDWQALPAVTVTN